jgi:acyl-CoA synthetase (AMP-forming)/AMP-acid ligase II
VVSEDGEEDVPTGQVGEVVCRGPTVFTGYEGAPEATAEAFAPGGWFRTGDLAQRLEGGALVVVDRKKDMVSKGRQGGWWQGAGRDKEGGTGGASSGQAWVSSLCG